MTDPLSLLNQHLAGRYELERELGRGGMATVYLARDLKHNRSVAIKVLKPELSAMVGAERFLAEIEVTAGLRHPHILPLFDSGEADGLLFYVMPFVRGETLRERLDSVTRLDVDEALSLTEDIAAALGHAHQHGVVHRDIKPANILIEDGEGLVADFGIAVALSDTDRRDLTGTGLSIGTPSYMSPEQIEGESAVDVRSDVYSLACLSYEMLTGEAPFAASTLQAVLARTLVEDPPSVREVRPEVPAEMDAAIRRALSKDPSERFAGTREFAEACRPVARAAPGRRTNTLVVAAAAVLVGVFGFLAWRSGQVGQAREQLDEVAALAAEGRYPEAYEIAVRAERWIPDDPRLAELFLEVADVVTITSTPAGADVRSERFDPVTPGEDVLLGQTPLVDFRLPRASHRLTISLADRPAAERIASSEERRNGRDDPGIVIDVALPALAEVPADMVPVPGGEYQLVSPDAPTGLSVLLEPFMIDRYEVTNEAYSAFITGGGYADDAWWSDSPDVDRGAFVDRTGLPGPRGWSGQSPPGDSDKLPVVGVTWHEAAAYCRSAGKRLTNMYEWEKTARNGLRSFGSGSLMPWGYEDRLGVTTMRANFSSTGPTPVDAFPFGISPYGAYDMAGNVREWLANPMGDGYAATGGAWDGPTYLYTEFGSNPAHLSSPSLGFRCARSDGEQQRGGGAIDLDTRTPVYTPVSEAEYRTLLAHYRYDPRPANARVAEVVEETSWTRETIWIDGVEADSVLLFFFAPRNVPPPYQTTIYVPGSGAFCCRELQDEARQIMGPVVQGGRAVVAVVLKGMIGRPWETGFVPPDPPSVRFRDIMVQQATELRMAVDYIETRGDVDMERLAYTGLSFGAGSRLAFSAVDDRYRAVVYIGGGIDERVKPTLPEADNVNFAPYVRVPKLLVNGRQDEEHPWLTRALPLWNLLSEPKELVLVDGAGHVPLAEDRVPPINAFFDRRFGQVVRRR